MGVALVTVDAPSVSAGTSNDGTALQSALAREVQAMSTNPSPEALPEPIYDVAIGAYKVAAYDGLIGPADIVKLNRALYQSSYTRSEYARPDTQDFRHWAVPIDLGMAQAMPIHAPALTALRQFDPAHRYRMYRCYVNVAQYGDMLFSHTDCEPGSGELTGLWYICEHWDPEWGGETMFFDHNMDVRAAIQPRPARFAVFNGEIPHVGRPPNRVCYASRFTLAMKFERVGAA